MLLWLKVKMDNLFNDEDGIETVEVLIIIAVLVAIALIFKNAITGFVNDIIGKLFNDGVVENITNGVNK